MDDLGEEKKTFDAELGGDEDSQPDPDEQLMLDQGNGRVWLVKVTGFKNSIQFLTLARYQKH